tara:strand:+ start:4262 stop:5149 length:888 start_codon:yes stop_codon:yes gene_type:complete
MKDSDQKDDYYSVSKQPPMPMGAPPPPPPMGMPPMGMPMGGPMPPGAPMPPQEEELQEGEYMDPATGKVMRRGEEFKVDPDRELDDPKNIAKWFDTIRKRSAAPKWTQNFLQNKYVGDVAPYTYPIAGEKQIAEGRDPTSGGGLDERGYTQDEENEEQGFQVRDARRIDTTPALEDLQVQREQDRYGARVAAYEKAREKLEPTMRQKIAGKIKGKDPYSDDVYYADDQLAVARDKLEAAKRGEVFGWGQRPIAEGHAYAERMPRPDAGETDAFGTPDMPYSQRFDTPSWMKEVKR